MVPFAILFTLNFGLLLAWTLVDPLRFERIKVDDNNPFSDTYGTCRFEHQETVGFAVAILLVDFFSILIACVQAYRAREIGDEFSESHWVAITMVSWFQVFVVGIPVMVLVQEQPTAAYFLKTSIIFIVCMSLLLFIFVPKVLIQRRNVSIRGSNIARKRNQGSSAPTGSQPFSGPLRTSDAASLDSNDAMMSDGIGMKIVRSPAILPAPTEVEKNLRNQIRELEAKVKQLEREDKQVELAEEPEIVESVPEPTPEQP